ncbi:CBS domain-containing protein [Actinospica acidithermotolerans]|nr:CBS domain-containing protein [Actinospica acidithermotolerans]
MTSADQTVAVPDDAAYRDIAALLVERRFSAVPVVDPQGRAIGVVSEDDLLAKETELEAEQEERHRFPLGGRSAERARREIAATTARRLMTSPAVTIGVDQDVAEAARIMLDRHVKRLVVTDEQGRLQGVVSRRDLLKVLARSDEEIRREVAEDVLHGMFRIDKAAVRVRVEDGVVHLRGRVGTRGQARLLCEVVARTDGVVAVADDLWLEDDSPGEGARTGPRGVFEPPEP